MSDSEEMTEFASIVERIERGEVPIKNIERELICPICKELFTHPLILPCQHSVCHKCVKELLMLNHDDSFDAGSESSVSGSPRSRVPSPSMERLDRLVRSGMGFTAEVISAGILCLDIGGSCCRETALDPD
ncbi:E3 ubiquitin-protein ligase trim36 [Ilyodon furcidens]|uniref:E3 ubiquitin-protein ligase trim36 n=1 Tax=Ilyodon furcidens TaxID=33524 RepID=A0ABV0V1Q1_9TELE